MLVAFNVLVFLFRDVLLPEDLLARSSASLEATLLDLGVFGYIGIVGLYTACAFLFIPLLIPLNILCGALYGPYMGTVISLVGITLGCIASTLSVRYVFRGMEKLVEKRPAAQKVLKQVEQRGDIMVIAVRLAFVVPYLLQNIALAITSIGIWRLTALTAIGSIPSAAIYSFLGAGLMRSENVSQFALYLAVPLLLFIVISFVLKRLNASE